MKQRRQQTILFLGNGNDARSRFAEILFNSVAGKMGLPWQVCSRGLAPAQGVHNVGPMLAAAIKALQALSARTDDASSQPPAPVTTDDLEKADRIVALNEEEHRPVLLERFAAHAEKIEFWSIADATKVLPLIEQQVMALVARILGGGNRPAAPSPEPADRTPAEPPKKASTVKVGRETAGRRGKGVTTVFDLPLDDDGLQELARKLKKMCGTGGTVKDRRIETQGDQRERLVAELEKLGYKVKRVGE